MAAHAEAAEPVEVSDQPVCAAPPVAGVRYVARQPILDLRGKVHGYELLFRHGTEAVFCGDGNMATRTMLDSTVLFGLGRLTAGLPAFVNCTEEALTRDLVHVLPSGMTVLEILEDIEPSRPVIEACRRLKASGFRLALDDFVWRPGIEPLVEIADYIKVDFCVTDRLERRTAAGPAERRYGGAGGGKSRDAGASAATRATKALPCSRDITSAGPC